MTITLEQVRAAAREVVTEAGPNTYRACYYSEEGRNRNKEIDHRYDYAGKQFSWNKYVELKMPVPEAENPLCIAGAIVTKLCGVEGLKTLIEAKCVDEQPKVFEALGFDKGSILYTQALQYEQDQGRAWDVALDRTERFALLDIRSAV